jgi:spore coat polysaccharide biosynthesis protein SpsF (cytidylyltransferase family)
LGLLGVVIQARIWAKRFPGKVLADLGGETVLQHLIRRCKQIRGVDGVYVATPDIALLPLIERYGAVPYLGSEDNVLGRYVNCAKANGLEAVVRLTGDCPFVDPDVVSELVELFRTTEVDYASNVLKRSYPYGLDCEACYTKTLESIIAKPLINMKYREHVTLYIREHLDEFKTRNLKHSGDWTAHDWRLDTPEDLPKLRALYSKCRASTLYPFYNVATLYSHGERLSVSIGAGSGSDRDSAAHGVNADATDATSHIQGLAWYERGYRHSSTG